MSDIWDDPEWEDLRRRVNKQPLPKKKKTKQQVKPVAQKPAQPPQNASEEPKKVEVNVKLTLPKVDVRKLPRPTKKQQRLIAIGASAVIGLILVITIVTKVGRKDASEGDQSSAGTSQKPEFDSILPDGKEESVVNGEVRYDTSKKVVNYRDVIGLVNVTISQQKLPESFTANPDEEVKKVAEGFSANEILREAHPRIYMGQAEEGPQTVIFHKDGILVFMLSTRALEKHEWVEYILKLK